MVVKKDRILKLGTVAALVLAIGGISLARTSVTMCYDKDYFEDHARMCQLWENYGIRPHHHHEARHHPRPVEEPVPVQMEAQGQMITVYRDRQASNDFRPDGYIALQTADDVAKSQKLYGFAGWMVSAFDMGRKHPPIFAQASPAERRQVSRTVTTRTVTTVEK